MMHRDRVFRVTAVESPEELAAKLFETIWTLCTAFSLGDQTWANDSTSPDGAQEYAVIRNGRQVESITVSWSTPERMAEYARQIAASNEVEAGPFRLRTAHPTGPCRLCA